VDAQKRAEAAVRESEQRLTLAVDAARLGTWEWDLGTDLIRCSATALGLFGVAEADFPGTRAAFVELVAPENRVALALALEEILRPGKGFNTECRVYRPDGGVRWLAVSGRPSRGDSGDTARVLGVVHDVTAHKEAAKRASEKRFRALVEHSADVFAVLDADGVYRYVTPAAQHVLGSGPDTLLGRLALADVHPEDVPALRQLFAELLHRPGETRALGARVRRADGSWRWVEGVASNWLQEPAIRGIALTLRDVSERKRLEDELRQAQRLEAVGRLAGGVAHDFNNLLTVISGFTSLLLSAPPQDGDTRTAVEQIHKAAERATGLTRQLLAFSRKQILHPTVLDLNQVVSGLGGMLRRLLREDVQVEMRLAEGLWPVRADPQQMEQTLMNLVTNARDAMPVGGRVSITTANRVLDAGQREAYPDLAPGEYVRLAVGDTGCGMDEATLSQVFEPFFTTKEQGQGTGLGLASVYGIVKQSGGSIYAHSVLGKGTVFEILLPRVQEAPSAAAEEPEPKALTRGSETVLLVEDEPAVRALAQRVLQLLGYRVLLAGDGAEALRVASEHGGPIDLLLTDVVMPIMHGTQLAERLTAVRPQTRVLFMSGYTDSVLVRRGVQRGETRWLPKPFRAEALAQKVREALDGSAAADEAPAAELKAEG
jgi:PAS domain S-box-containing protein